MKANARFCLYINGNGKKCLMTRVLTARCLFAVSSLCHLSLSVCSSCNLVACCKQLNWETMKHVEEFLMVW